MRGSKHILVIMASGKSTRFGGFPKAFCNLDGERNVDRTIRLASMHYNGIYVVVNQEMHSQGDDAGLSATVIPIVTGQGDADSILRGLRKIRQLDPSVLCATVCWGDAVFVDETPFAQMEEYVDNWKMESSILVGCCMDPQPYAWFDTEGNRITQAHFRKEEPPIACGLHDQSIFSVRIDCVIANLEQLRERLGLNAYDESSYKKERGEMRLLDAFQFFYQEKGLLPAEYRMIEPNRVFGFNTQEELKAIVNSLKEHNSNFAPCIIAT